MARYERLFEETRNSRRTIADALDLLRDARGLKDSDQANIRIELLKLPSGDVGRAIQFFRLRSNRLGRQPGRERGKTA